MRQRRVTHKDVAERAGVSVATVSYVINHGPRPVSADARRRVEEAVAELGYVPNDLARSLRLQQTSLVGLMIPSLANPVYGEIARELERVCTQRGMLVVLCNSERAEDREQRFVRILRAKQVDGVVMTPHGEALPLLEPLLGAHIPVVVLEHSLPGVHCIVIDEMEGGRLATQHLIDLGHRRIGLIRRQPTSAMSWQRHDGYRLALANAGIAYNPALVVHCGSSQAEGYAAMQRLLALAESPTGVFVHNDILAMGAMRAIYDAGLSIPGQVSLVGYDDIASAAYLSPPLTTVRFPKIEMGALAGRTILKLAQESTEVEAQTVTLSVELIVRSSTAAPRPEKGAALDPVHRELRQPR
jgi:LacI family transcriptional regulator